MKKVLADLIKSFGQAVWTVAAIVCAVLVYVALRDAGHAVWLQWVAPMLVIVVFALIFAFVPRPWNKK